MKTNQPKKNKKIILVASIIVFVAVLLMFIFAVLRFYPYWAGIDNYKIFASVEVTPNRAGFDLNSTALTFGLIRSNGTASATRSIVYNNSRDFPVIMKISSEGNITQLLSYENNIRIEAYENKSIKFRVSSPGPETGYYDGWVNFKVVPAS